MEHRIIRLKIRTPPKFMVYLYNINQKITHRINQYFNLWCLLHVSKERVHLHEDSVNTCMVHYVLHASVSVVL
jgi:hypothetical protein